MYAVHGLGYSHPLKYSSLPDDVESMTQVTGLYNIGKDIAVFTVRLSLIHSLSSPGFFLKYTVLN
jgi:hypothetical protein